MSADGYGFDDQEMWVRPDGTLAPPENLKAHIALAALYDMTFRRGLAATLDSVTRIITQIGTCHCVQYNEFLLRHRPADWHAIKRREEAEENDAV